MRDFSYMQNLETDKSGGNREVLIKGDKPSAARWLILGDLMGSMVIIGLYCKLKFPKKIDDKSSHHTTKGNQLCEMSDVLISLIVLTIS